MEIRLSSCTLRPWKRGDEDSLVRTANNRKVWLNLRDLFPYPYTSADAAAWISGSLHKKAPCELAIVVGGEAVGSVGVTKLADVHRRSAEIGYWLGEEYWGRGITTEAVRAATERAFKVLDVVRIQATVFGGNRASMRVLEKCGYEKEGWLRKSVFKDGAMVDSAIYAILKEPLHTA